MRYLAILCVLLATAVCAAETPFGLETRTSWTTSNFRGRPEPPLAFKAERIFPHVNFKQPTVISNAPGTKRFFVGEQQGKIFSLPADQNCQAADLFVDVNDLIAAQSAKDGREGKQAYRLDGMYGLTFHPDFQKNRRCYVCYVMSFSNFWVDGAHPNGSRVVSLKVTEDDPPRAIPESEEVIITWLQGGHNGGCIKFGPDGCLYISTGDGGFAFPPDGGNTGQDITDLESSILRIDVDHRDQGRAYAIPADNPFADKTNEKFAKARGEVWSYGVRNPWKISFDRKLGDLWVGDVGWEMWELIYRVKRGDNYGWSIMEGSQPVHDERERGPTPIVPAAVEIPHTDGASVTGGFVYRGKNFPELDGIYLFGDWETRRIWGVKIDGDKVGPRHELVEPTVRVVDFAEDNDGELYLLDYDDGTIHAIVRNEVDPSQPRFPTKLSETGIFADVAKHNIAPGVLPFSINAPMWADYASAERFLGIPGDGAIALHPKATQIAGSMFSRSLDFPKDSVLVKTQSLETVQGEPATKRRVETQVLHFDGRDWRGYAYLWNNEQTDAELVPSEGTTRTFKIKDAAAPGGEREQPWRVASRMECIRCHNPWAEFSLAFNPPQLNRDHDYASLGGRSDNQLRTLKHLGVIIDKIREQNADDSFDVPEQPLSISETPHLANPYDAGEPVDARGRAYLHVNCAHCHRFGGGGSAYVHLPFDVKLADMKAVDKRPGQGTFGIADAKLLAPGDPYKSVMFLRMAKDGPGHMPQIGTHYIDAAGLEVMHDWIRQLPMYLDDDAKLARLAELDEQTIVAREAKDFERTRYGIARGIAQEDKRKTPNDLDLQKAQAQADKDAAQRVKDRADERQRLIGEMLASPSKALMLARALRKKQLPESIAAMTLATATSHATSEIRDLFEPLLPDNQRSKRLGEIINIAELLKLSGDVERGKTLFHTGAIQCRNCHCIDKTGTPVGPDLNAIGKKLDRAKLLESLVEPSKTIDAAYAPWIVETTSGQLFTGLLVSKDDKQIVIKNAQGKQHTFAAGEVEAILPQRQSLMPELLLKDMTAEQVADLLAYLESLK